MKNNTSRIIIETMVRNAIRDIKDSPKRSMRNLVDMALNFSGGRFQQRFFSATQTMLKNENSAYFELVQNVVSHVDEEHLVRFGVNLGYNSCTEGAKLIREIEEKQGYNVPWMLTVNLDTTNWNVRAEQYQNIIRQGEEMGIYTWQLFADKQPERALSLAAEFPNSAFIIYCRQNKVAPRFLDEAAELDNLMLAVRYDESAEEFCKTLREMKLLYSVYCIYSDEDACSILSDDLFYEIQQFSPTFVAFIPEIGCPAETRAAISVHVRKLREEQRFPMLPWEAVSDCFLVDGIISGDACVVAFSKDGFLYICDKGDKKTGFNCFDDDLKTIFQNALQRKE